MAGGRNFALNDAYESAELYSPLTETFTHTGSMTDGRWSHTATRLADGRVLVAGRFTDPATSANAQPVLTSAELYNPATTHVVADRPMTTRRALHVAEALPDGRVLVAGGRTCHAPPPTACNSDFTTETGRDLQPGHRHVDAGGQHDNRRTTTSAVLLQNGTVLVPAGFPRDQNTAETYNPATNTWTPTGNLNLNRARQGAMLLPDGTVHRCRRRYWRHPPLSSETYNPATNTWTYAGNVAQPRFNNFFTEAPNGKVLIAGGSGPTNPASTSEVYDPATRTWSSAGTLPNPHGSSSNNGNSTRMVVLTGTPARAGRTAARSCWWVTTPPAPPSCTRRRRRSCAPPRSPAPSPASTCPPAASPVLTGDGRGHITVQPGGSLVLNGSLVAGGVLSQGSTGVRICGSQIRSANRGGTAIGVSGTVGPVVIGDGTAGCARNDISGRWSSTPTTRSDSTPTG